MNALTFFLIWTLAFVPVAILEAYFIQYERKAT